MPKQQCNQKNVNNYEFLTIFIKKFKSLTAKSISAKHYDDVINADNN